MADPTFPAYLALTAALVLTPGATTAVVVRNAVTGGRRSGIAAAVGAAIGNTAHAIAAGLGVALIVSRFPLLLTSIRFLGGVYLAWLGIQSVRRALRRENVPAARAITESSDRVHHQAFREGITVNLLNPAIIVFYLVVVPTFMPTGAAPIYYVLLAAVHVMMAFVAHCAWVLGFSSLGPLLQRPIWRATLECATGAALLLLSYLTIRSIL